MTGHTRLYRRGATYYHRAAIPIDIVDSYPKTEETFSLKTKDHHEALKLVRVAAIKVDRLFDKHRDELRQQSQPFFNELSNEQIKRIGDIYYAFRLEEDEEIRLDGFYEEDGPLPVFPVPSFEEYVENVDDEDETNRHYHARGKINDFYLSEAEEVLAWSNVNLRISEGSPSWNKLARELQTATIKASTAIKARSSGDTIETPQPPDVTNSSISPLLSEAVEVWANEKARTEWVKKTGFSTSILTRMVMTSGSKQLRANE